MSGKTGSSPLAGDDTELERHRTVQELADDGGDVPERYIIKESPGGDEITASLPLMDLPVIDFNRLLTSSATAAIEELQKLKSALSSWGCFQVINHGIEFPLLDEVKENGRQFFKLPMEEKHNYSRGENDIEGYGNDMVLYDNQALDWTDRLYLLVHPEDDRKLHYWPQNPKSFREALEEYTTKLRNIVEILLRSMAKALELAEDSFLNQYGKRPVMYTRFNFYPPCQRPDLVRGLKPHADGSAITVVLPDEQVEGLQFRIDGRWVRITIGPRALLVNAGDQLEMMSNGIFKSPVHRVVTNKEKERMSVATFCAPGVGEEVGPVEELVDDRNPRMYETVRNYPEIYFKYYQQGRRPIGAVKL
ncbi:hypothetical protein OROHE_026914 [Orobanche hederae]